MTAQPIHNVVIIGGGITGLTVAHTLMTSDVSLDVVLVESEEKLGGKIVTERVDGFVIEGGPDSFVSYKPWGIELCRKLGLENRLTGTNRDQKATYILYRKRLMELPEGLTLLAPTRLVPFMRSPLFSVMGKLRIGLDLLISKRDDPEDESLAGFVRRRLGQEAVDRLAGPLLAGIYAGDPERMSLRATFPQLAELEQKYGSLIRGMLTRRKEMAGISNESSTNTMFMTLQGGLGELVEALIKQLERVRLLTGRRVIRLSPGKESDYALRLDDGQELSTDVIVLTTPAFVTAGLVERLNPELSKRLYDIRYVSTATVTMAFKREGFPHPLDGFGFVVGENQSRGVMACTWTSTKFPHRAPPDHVLLRCFVGGEGREEVVGLSDEALIRLVRQNLQSDLGIVQEPVLVKVYRWIRANPQYDVGHLDRVATIEDEVSRHPGLFLAGAAYHGVGIPDCIQSGKMSAQKALNYLKPK
jgi:protoporphyrinogen/coproporphyrinogen III oxidase